METQFRQEIRDFLLSKNQELEQAESSVDGPAYHAFGVVRDQVDDSAYKARDQSDNYSEVIVDDFGGRTPALA